MTKRNGIDQKDKQLKPRQVALVKNLLDGMTLTEAARRAGYSKKCPGQAGYQESPVWVEQRKEGLDTYREKKVKETKRKNS